MAQSNFEERIDTYEIESTNVMTGDRDRSRYLYYQLKMSMAKAKQIDIIVSFLMESGVRMTMKKIVPIKNCLVSSRNGLMKC